MSSLGRRQALGLFLGMGAVSTLAPLARPASGGVAPRDRPDLAALFPRRIGAWREDARATGIVPLPEQDGRAYGLYDALLERVFTNAQGQRMMLSVAYGSDQSPNLQLHRPEACYAAAGFAVSGIQSAEIVVAGRPLPVERLLAETPTRSEPATYWMVLGGQVVSGHVTRKLHLLLAGMRREHPAGLLVRVSSIDADAAAAQRRQAQFIDEMVLAMDSTARRFTVGSAD